MWIALGAVFAAFVTFLIAERFSAPNDSRALSTRNPAPDGAMALAEILGRHGVGITPTDTLEDTLAALSDDDTTVLLYDPRGFLDRSQLQDVRAAAGRVVVVAPRLRTLNGLDPGIRPGGVVPEATKILEPGCGQEDAEQAGSVAAQGPVYLGPVVCYATRSDGPGLYVASEDEGVIVLGSTGLLENQHLAAEGNAALAIRTLGSSSDLVWYTPGLTDVASDRSAPTLSELAPPWLAFAGPWLAVIAILAILWRGRRLGPLVFEPLPVVVQGRRNCRRPCTPLSGFTGRGTRRRQSAGRNPRPVGQAFQSGDGRRRGGHYRRRGPAPWTASTGDPVGIN
ncbi:DUF4350 domain-containing protein [Arthrobacter sp. alpha11c]